MRRVLALLSLVLAPAAAAQQDGVLQLDSDLERFLVRQQAAGRLPSAQLTHRPLAAYQAQAYLDSLAVFDSLAVRGANGGTPLSTSDRTLLAQFRGLAPLPGAAFVNRRVGWLYGNGQDAVSVEGDGYALQFNPLANLSAGQARRTETSTQSPSVFVYQNTRGAQASGHLGDRLFFEARIEENQRRDARFFHYGRTSPRLADTQILGIQDGDSLGYDYYRVAGVLGVRTRFVELRGGRDRNVWGYGRSSLMLSNYAPSYDHLQVRAKVWRIEYTALYAALVNQAGLTTFQDQILPRSYASMHRLNVTLPAGVELEAFESVFFADDTTAARRRQGFDVAYLNPLLLLRSAEQDRGSPDNASIGVGAAWTTPWNARVYGSLFLDEFEAKLIFKDDSWRNKWAFTLGGTVADWPVPGLMVRTEYTRIRPFVYTHYNYRNSYTHYLDLLGHPAGPNASDWMLEFDYRPTPRLAVAGTYTRTVRGRSSAATGNIGDDPLREYDNGRISDQIPTLGGVRQALWAAEGRIGYQALPRLWLDAMVRAESTDDAETGVNRYVAPYVSLRWGLPFESLRY